MSTIPELLTQAALIRDETIAGANSAQRVGDFCTNLVETISPLLATPPGVTLSVSGGLTSRRIGSSTAVSLSWGVTRRTYPLATISIAGTSVDPTPGLSEGQTQSGSLSRTANNLNTQTYTATVTDSAGASVSASVTIAYKHERFFFTTATDLLDSELSAGALSAILNAVATGGRELADSRLMTKSLVAIAARLTVAYRASYGTGPVYVNGVVNTAFGSRTFPYTNPEGVVEDFVLEQGQNVTTGTYSLQQT